MGYMMLCARLANGIEMNGLQYWILPARNTHTRKHTHTQIHTHGLSAATLSLTTCGDGSFTGAQADTARDTPSFLPVLRGWVGGGFCPL